MTARQCFEGLLTELSKVNAPSMLLSDFNYFFNKALNQYINKRYNIYDINQQTTDDLRVLKSTTILTPTPVDDYNTNANGTKLDLNTLGAGQSKLFGATYEVNLPLDYLHVLNCVCVYKVNERFKCYDKGNNVQFAAKRLTADSWSNVLNDFYNRPLPERPYYYIHNVNKSTDIPTNPISSNTILDKDTTGTDSTKDYSLTVGTDGKTETGESNLPRTIDLKGINNKSLVEREAGVRYGNASNARMEIRYGHDSSIFELIAVVVDYIKAPQTIRLTQEQVNLTKDTSQMMEFPDYVCQEIINELVHLVMENTADPRLQTHVPVTQSIANPTQQQQQPQPQAQSRQRQG